MRNQLDQLAEPPVATFSGCIRSEAVANKSPAVMSSYVWDRSPIANQLGNDRCELGRFAGATATSCIVEVSLIAASPWILPKLT